MATKVEPKKEEKKEEKKEGSKDNKETATEPTTKIADYKPMKKGDYSVHILVEEVKNLISKDEDRPYPIIKISVNNVSKRTKEVNAKVETYFYGEHFYYDCLDMNNASLDSAKVIIEVYDKQYSDRQDYLGIYEFDFSFVYNNAEHSLKNYWVALANPESDDFSKIRGYLRFSISILHTDDPRVELSCSTNSGKDGLIALPPQIKPQYYQVNLMLFKAKGVPDMDSIFVNKNKKECNAFIKATYMGTTVKTSVIDMKDNLIIFNETLSLPVSYPIVSHKICCSIWDKDALSDDIIGSFEITVDDILAGHYDNFRYIHFYGAPLGVSGEFTNKMNENSEIGSLWKGKILAKCDYAKKEYPKSCLTTIPSNSPVLVDMGKLREKTLWNFEITVENALFLPFENESYMLKIIIEEQETDLPAKKSVNGMINWNITRNLSIYSLSENIEDIGDMFVYLVQGDEDNGKNRICFQRLQGKYFVDNNEFIIMKFYPDPSIGKVDRVSKSGLLKIRVKLTCQGKSPTELQQDPIDKIKSGLKDNTKDAKTNNTIPQKSSAPDSDEDDLDNMVTKKKQVQQQNAAQKEKDKLQDNKAQVVKTGTCTVVCNIHQTRNIVPGDDDGISDLYVKVRLLDQTSKTTIKYKTINGIFNECLVFNNIPFNISDEKTYPVAFLEVFDQDTFSQDDDLGFAYVWITDCGFKVNSLEAITPTWVNLYLPLSNKKQGKVLMSFYIIDSTRQDLVQQVSKLDISPPTQLYNFEINVLGLRGLQPKGIIPVKKPFILFDLNSISVLSKDKMKGETNEKSNKTGKKDKDEESKALAGGDKSSSKDSIKTQPKESGCDPTINTVISFENYLPTEKIFIPNMLCFVYDYILAGLGNSVLGAFEIDLNRTIEETVNEMNNDMRLSEKAFVNLKLGNSLVKNSLLQIEADKKSQEETRKKELEEKAKQGSTNTNAPSNNKKPGLVEEGGLEEKKEPFLNPETIKVEVKDGEGVEEIVDTSKKPNPMEEDKNDGTKKSEFMSKLKHKENKENPENKDSTTTTVKPLKKEVINLFSNLVQKDLTDDGEQTIKLPKFICYKLPASQKPEPVDDKSKKGGKDVKKDPKEVEKEKKAKEIAEKRRTVYVIEDDKKVPDFSKYVELGYTKASTLREGQTLEEAAKEKTNKYKKHYRRIYHLPLEDPKNGLGITCPFVKIPIRVGAYDDKVDKNQIFKALSNNKNKVLKEFKKRSDNENMTVSSVGQDVELKEAGYFKGLVRVCDKKKLLDFKDFTKKIDNKCGGHNHLNKYEELSKKMLNPKEVMVRLYLLDLTQLAEKDSFSKSDPYIKIMLGKDVIDENKTHYDDLTDVSIRKCYDLTTTLPGASLLKIQVWDYDPIFSDELIGETVIDIEDRYYDFKWQEIKDKPIETRPLLHPDFHQPQGFATMWLEIVDKSDKNNLEKYEIGLNPDAKAEIRLIIWETKDIPNMDVEATSDLYVNAFIDAENKQSTDVHFRCQTGVGSFNWRMLFPVALPRKDKSNYLNVQVFDKDYFSGDDYICNAVLNLEDYLKRIYQLDTPLKFTQEYYNSLTQEEKLKMFECSSKEFLPEWGTEDDDKKDNRFWIHMKRPNKDGVSTAKTGAVLVSLEVMPQWKSDICKVGTGRDEPNCNPYLPPPLGRFEWSLNPFKMFNQCVGPSMRKKICQLLCVIFCLLWCVFLVPYMIVYISGEVINPFNWWAIADKNKE